MKDVTAKSLEGSRLFEPSMLEDPYPVYRQLRETDPVHWEETLSAWVVTRYDDVTTVMNDRRFSSDRVSLARKRFPEEELRPLWDVFEQLMLQRDEPEHKRLRNLVHAAFVRTAVEEWEPKVRTRVEGLLQAGLDKGELEFVWEFAVPLPLLVIAELVGIPEEDRDRVKAWCDDFSVVATNFYAKISHEQLRKGLQSTQAFRAYLLEKVEPLRTSPHRDLLSSLVQVEQEGERLALDELLANVLLLLNAGNETTTNLLGNGLAALYRHPDQFERLRDHPELLPSAVEEFLRYDAPVQFLGRVALEEVALRDKTIRKGDLVLTMLGSANRDPERFADPDRLDIGRTDNHHVSFGHGHHFCVGAQLARLEAKIAFAKFFELAGHATLDTTLLSHRENFNLRCFNALPLKMERTDDST